MSARRALVAGATGLVGSAALTRLLAHPAYGQVTALVRRPLGRTDPKLTERIVDFENLAAARDAFSVDDVYMCLGTTIKIAGSQERFRRVDHDYAILTARLAREAGATRAALVSAIGASVESGVFYSKVKGETERDLLALGFDAVTIARPSFLVGERTEKRAGEGLGIALSQALAFTLVGRLRVYRPIAADVVAAALIRELVEGSSGTHILTFDEMSAARAGVF